MVVLQGVTVCHDDVSVTDFARSKVDLSVRENADDAFIVCNLGEVIKKWQLFREYLPNVQPYYAVKCNPDATILALLKGLGVNFDCASKGEIQQLLDMGVAPDRIIYANPCKQSSHLSYARSNNVKMMTFDNECELNKIKKYYPNADLVIRIKVDDSKSLIPLGNKFGVHKSEVRQILKTARSLGLNVIGVSFHVGCSCSDESAYYDAVKLAKMVFDEGSDLGYKFHLLDVGGGFPGTENGGTTFKDIARCINAGIAEYFPQNSGVRVIAEPGRLFAELAYTLVCNVIGAREIAYEKCDRQENEFYYYVNEGIYGSLGNVVYEKLNPIPYPLSSSDQVFEEFKCTIWGQTCDSLDLISKSLTLPKMFVGDWLCFSNMGAYTLSLASEFNGFKKPVIFYMCSARYTDYIAKL